MVKLQSPFSLSARVESLHSHWAERTAELFQRDVFQNTAGLIEAAEKIRDGYFELFATKQPLLKQITDLKKQKASADTIEQIQTQIDDVDYDLIRHNHDSFVKLQSDPLSLSSDDAKRTMGSIIGRTLDTFEIACRRDGLIRPTVPHVPLQATPENVGRTRSEPAPIIHQQMPAMA